MAAAGGALSLLSTPNVTADGSIFVRLLNTPHGSAYLGVPRIQFRVGLSK